MSLTAISDDCDGLAFQQAPGLRRCRNRVLPSIVLSPGLYVSKFDTKSACEKQPTERPSNDAAVAVPRFRSRLKQCPPVYEVCIVDARAASH